MKIRIGRLYTLTLISLLSLFGLAQAGAQDNISNQRNGSSKLRGQAEKTHQAEAKTAGNSLYSVLYSFCSAPNCTDGEYPLDGVGLVQDATGNLYGTTSSGGANGYGTVFELDNAGQETVLHSFVYWQRYTDGDALV